MNPRGLALAVSLYTIFLGFGIHTPGARALRDSCIRTLIVSAIVSRYNFMEMHSTYLMDGTQELPSYPHHRRLEVISNVAYQHHEQTYL